jgi:hypothetical protein
VSTQHVLSSHLSTASVCCPSRVLHAANTLSTLCGFVIVMHSRGMVYIEFGSVQVTVELKNDLAITGTLHSVDQYMNIKLDNVKVVNEDKFPHMVRT